jgi:hypothetical protein
VKAPALLRVYLPPRFLPAVQTGLADPGDHLEAVVVEVDLRTVWELVEATAATAELLGEPEGEEGLVEMALAVRRAVAVTVARVAS